MFSIFRKKTTAPDPKPFVGFRRGRGSGGHAFHIINGENWEALCGVAVVERRSTITKEEIQNREAVEHQGFYYCSDCVNLFLS